MAILCSGRPGALRYGKPVIIAPHAVMSPTVFVLITLRHDTPRRSRDRSGTSR
ncbi:hypothetical protein [Streptomyces sp. NPDC006875]|uniref:hypothetical protein n=1 Tax=Streptomyces sp. NPDC006875 TaxID=3154781 RepID=UPI00340D3A84